jgi:hypothetical protein
MPYSHGALPSKSACAHPACYVLARFTLNVPTHDKAWRM